MIYSIFKKIFKVVRKKLVVFFVTLFLLSLLTQYMHKNTRYNEVYTLLKPQPSSINLTFYDTTGSLINKIFRDTLAKFHLEYEDADSQTEFLHKFISSYHNKEIQKKFKDFLDHNELYVDTKKNEFLKYTLRESTKNKDDDLSILMYEKILFDSFEKLLKNNIIASSLKRAELIHDMENFSDEKRKIFPNNLPLYNIEFINFAKNIDKGFEEVFIVKKKNVGMVNKFQPQMLILLFLFSIAMSIVNCFVFNEFFSALRKIRS